MVKIEIKQGDLLNVDRLSYPVMVVSNTYFNRAGIEQQFLIIKHSSLKNKGSGTGMQEESRERCPNCGSSNIAKIIWGLPDFTEELQKRIDAGEIVLGGCIPGKGDYECNECGMRFRSAHSVMDWNRQE